MDFITAKVQLLASLPTIIIVALLVFLIFKVVMKTIVKVILIAFVIVLALFFWQTIRMNLQNRFGLVDKTQVQNQSN